MLKPGDKAPDFTLQSDKGDTVSLQDFIGKSDVVLYFYPRDNTSGCTKEACSFRDSHDEFQKRNVVVLGVSPDSVKSHQNFINKQDLNFTLLSDPERTTAQAYGAWGEKKMYGKTRMGIIRSTFIIGQDGFVKHVYAKVKPADHGTEILETLATF